MTTSETKARSTVRIIMVTLLIVVVALVVADLLIDAGIIKTSIRPVVDLIPN